MPWLSWIISNILLASLLALTAWFMQRCLRRHAIAHILWLLVLIKLVTPPLISVSLETVASWRMLPASAPALAASATTDIPAPVLKSACQNGTCLCGPHVIPASLAVLPWILLAVWSIGFVTTGWNAWCRWTRFRLLLSHAVPAPAEWQSLASRLSAELSLRHPPEILMAGTRLPPLVVPGWHRPSVLLPADLMDRLDGPQRTVLLLHELTHLQRRDHVVRILEMVVGVVYWWLPIVHLIGRQLRTCEECCCDAVVVSRQPHARRDYARLLLDVLDFVSPLPLAIEQATAMNSSNDLEHRLRTILATSQSTPHRMGPIAVLAFGLGCGIVPCQLHYDWTTPPARLTTSTTPESAAETCLPPAIPKRNPASAFCCP